MRLLDSWLRFMAIAALATSAHAATSFRIESVFTNLDGEDQYVVLRESAGRDGEQAIGGLVLRSTANGVVRDYTIPRHLFSASSAGKAVVIASSFGVPSCCTHEQVYLPATGEFEMRWFTRTLSGDFKELPARFLSVDGGTLELVGADAWTYGPLPTTGHHALARDGSAVVATFTPYWVATFAYPIVSYTPWPAQVLASGAAAREYYHAGHDRYLLTANAQDIEAIEHGIAPGWVRAENGFGVYTTSGATVSGPAATAHTYGTVPVCRYYLPPPRDSHVLSAFAAECAAFAAIPGAILESKAAFYAYPPDPVTGSCGNRWTVYRLWNGRADANHRWTTSTEQRDTLIAKGWIPEGAGPLGVAFCGTENDWDWWL